MKTKPWSDIDLDNWRDYNEVLTDSLWLFDNRAKGDGHKLDYYGGFIPQIATQLIYRYTKEDEIVLDLFMGSGTSAIEALRLNRRFIGVELNSKLVNYVLGKLPLNRIWSDQACLLVGDSASSTLPTQVGNALIHMKSNFAHLLVLHPPYGDIIKFTDDHRDLSRLPDVESFLDAFEIVARHGHMLLAPDRFAALIIGDKYAKGELVPLSFRCMDRMMRVGFTPKAIVVKNIEGNEQGKGKNGNLWRYRALAGGFYNFKHEYIIVFQKRRK